MSARATEHEQEERRRLAVIPTVILAHWARSGDPAVAVHLRRFGPERIQNLVPPGATP